MKTGALLLACAGTVGAAWAQSQPQPQPAPAPAPRIADEAIRDAVKATVAEMPKLPPPDAKPDFSGGVAGPGEGAGSRAAIDRAFIAAEVGSCWGSDALKHNPPVIMLGGVPLALGGLLALPHVFHAASSGKCK